jgi:hypothetical protein
MLHHLVLAVGHILADRELALHQRTRLIFPGVAVQVRLTSEGRADRTTLWCVVDVADGSGLAVNVSLEAVFWHVESGVVADGSIGSVLGRCENGVRTNLSVRGVTIYVNGGIAASVSIATIVQGRC